MQNTILYQIPIKLSSWRPVEPKFQKVRSHSKGPNFRYRNCLEISIFLTRNFYTLKIPSLNSIILRSHVHATHTRFCSAKTFFLYRKKMFFRLKRPLSFKVFAEAFRWSKHLVTSRRRIGTSKTVTYRILRRPTS